jgi:orotate phosphoribosyltransferase
MNGYAVIFRQAKEAKIKCDTKNIVIAIVNKRVKLSVADEQEEAHNMKNASHGKAEYAESVSGMLLDIGAVVLRPNDPFTWSSGLKAPIYCDNRLTISYPHVRQKIARALCELVRTHYSDAEVIAGAATGGIPHAAWVADLLNLPMVYVRSSAKGHGKQNQVEGRLHPGQRVVIIEDLISTGKSSLQVAQALREAEAEVLGVAAIFTYEFGTADRNFESMQIPYQTVTSYSSLLNVSAQANSFTKDELCKLEQWRDTV